VGTGPALKAQRETNDRLGARNATLEAEVRDLKTGYDAIEERARSELGMIKQQDEGVLPGPRAALPLDSDLAGS
jgi:cell division protein FtsB